MRSHKELLSAALISAILINLTLIIYIFLVKLEPFSFYKNMTTTCFVAGLFYGLALALLIKSTKLGVFVGLFPIVLSTSIGGAEQAIVSIVFAFLFTLGFLGGFLSSHILIKFYPNYHFVLDTSPKQH